MSDYKVSLDVVRRANERMARRNYTGSVPNGQFVVNVKTGTISKSKVITSSRIKAAYKKAIQSVISKAF